MKKTVACVASVLVLAAAATWWLAPDALPEAPVGIPRVPAAASVPRVASHDGASLREPVVSLPAESRHPLLAAPASGSLLVRLVWGDDRTPASNVVVQVHELARPQRYESPLVLTTDAAGAASFARVLAGEVLVAPELGSRQRVTVMPDAEAHADIMVERGYDVAGFVVDGGGQPVAGAEVLLSDLLASIRGRVVAVTDERGAFVLRSLGGRRAISARSERHAPSQKQSLLGTSGARLDLRLVLGAAAGSIQGRVLDANGKPVSGATARVNDRLQAYWLPPAVTDAAGAFGFSGLAPGKTTVEVRGAGYVPLDCSVDVVAGRPTPVDVRLEPGGTIRGKVRTSDHKPVPGAFVSAFRSQPAKTGLGAVTAWTGTDGSFEIVGVAPGAVEATVATDGYGTAGTKLELAALGTARWDPVLDARLTLAGRLVDDTGQPVATGWHVALSKQASKEESALDVVEPAADGSFRFVNVPDEELRLRATPTEGHAFFRATLLERLCPGANVELRIPGGMPSVRIYGIVLDARGAPCPTAVVQPVEPTCNTYGSHVAMSVDAATGRFALGPYPPGTWTVRVFARASTGSLTLWRAQPDAVLGPRVLGPNGSWDLGTVRLP